MIYIFHALRILAYVVMAMVCYAMGVYDEQTKLGASSSPPKCAAKLDLALLQAEERGQVCTCWLPDSEGAL